MPAEVASSLNDGAIHVAPLSAVHEVARGLPSYDLLTLLSPDTDAEALAALAPQRRLHLVFHDIVEAREGLIVPSGDLLTVEVHVPPTDIDQVSVGQRGRLRFVAFNQRTTPEVAGTITRIAADLSREPQTGATFYIARIAADEAGLKALGDLKLVPGMPVEAFIETSERTALSYILKPLSDQLARAFREE